MNAKRMQTNLGQLMTLRERELEQQQAQLAAKEQLRDRQAATLRRLEQLNAQIGPTGSNVASLAHNSAAYKQAVLQWAEQQRQQLAQQEAEVAAQRQAMLAVARKQQAYGQLLERAQTQLRGEAKRAEQKSTDDIASQVWMRRAG